jgi:hypothetical protein
MNPDATMNDLAGADLRGLDRFKARKGGRGKTHRTRCAGKGRALHEQRRLQRTRGCAHRAAPERAVVPEISKRAEVEGLCGDGRDEVLSRALGEGLRPLDERHSGLVHQSPALVGASDSSVVSATHSAALQKEVAVIQLDPTTITGTNIRALRDAAWTYAETHGLIGKTFRNDDTGFQILVAKSSLEHAFANLGVVNVKLVSQLPELLKTAVLILTEPHEPYSPEILAVHVFYGALNTEGGFYRVKFTVKEFHDHRSFTIIKLSG